MEAGESRQPGQGNDTSTLLRILTGARIDCLSVRRWRVGPEWSLPARTLGNDFLFMPLEGRLAVDDGRDGSPRWTLEPHRCLVVPRGVVHGAHHLSPSCRLDVLAVHLQAGDAQGGPLLGDALSVVALAEAPWWWSAWLQAEAQLAADGAVGMAWGACLARLCLGALVQGGLALGGGMARDARLGPVLDAIHAHPEAAHAIPELAQRAGLGAVRFRQVFLAATGTTPKAYLDRLRLARAAALLRAGSAPVAQVAKECGFASTRHFLARFRATHGVPPTAWRRGAGDRP